MHRSEEFKVGMSEGVAIAIAVLTRSLKNVKGFDIAKFHSDLALAEKATEASMGIESGVLSTFNAMVASYQMQGVRVSLDACKGQGIATLAIQKLDEASKGP
ncbi:hypothetical protein [Zymobacter sp. IVIA_5232.4 C2]|uniref:hypothetical protein n=1 Tax=Zymobacter sp. IVIA_5232.4 C2 TaxID=3394855 RepID=UPI0039C05C60